MTGSEIEITGGGLLGHGIQVRLNGAEVPGLRAVRLEFEADRVTVADLELSADRVHIDAQALAILRAHVPADGPATAPEACPHPPELREPRTTFGGPKRFYCGACDEVVTEPSGEEG